MSRGVKYGSRRGTYSNSMTYELRGYVVLRLYNPEALASVWDFSLSFFFQIFYMIVLILIFIFILSKNNLEMFIITVKDYLLILRL